MKGPRGASLIFATAVVGLTASFSTLVVAQQGVPDTIANNDSIFVDGKTFKIVPGKAKGVASGQIKTLGARDLGPGAIIFRSGEKLYIVDVPLLLQGSGAAGGQGVYVKAEEEQVDRIRIEYVPPKKPEHQKLYDQLKEQRALEILQQIFSPFRLPVELNIKTTGCDMVNAWYDREGARPVVTLCYEYLQHILQSMPKETTAAGVTPTDAVLGQLFYVVAHEVGHAIFDIFDVPSFGREEDAADQFSAYIMLQFGKERAHRLIGGAAYSYREYIKDYKQNPKVQIPLAAFSSNHGTPEERFYNLLCTAYGADPKGFADVVEKEYLPKTRADGCKFEYRGVTHAFRNLISPHVDQQMARKVLDTTWLPELRGRPAAP